MKTTLAIYPGSFNPWHRGHTDILRKALMTFDRVVVAHGRNPDKDLANGVIDIIEAISKVCPANRFANIEVRSFDGLLVDLVKELNPTAIVRGLRNSSDLQYEQDMQYWNEDLGITIPTVFFICDREVGHISSSTIRGLKKMGKWPL